MTRRYPDEATVAALQRAALAQIHGRGLPVADGSRTIAFEVPGRPVPLARARKGKGGRWYTPARSNSYKQSIAARFIASGHARLPPHTGDVQVHIRLHPHRLEVVLTLLPTKTKASRGDVDNFAKAVMDALTGLAYVDDRQIVQLSIDRTPTQ